MLSFQFYNLVHIVGIILLMAALGGIALTAVESGERSPWNRKVSAISHGLGLFLVLLGGFGMMARMGITHGVSWPGWVWVKAGVWVLLGAAIVLPRRFPASAKPVLLLLPVLGGLAAYMAIYKPL